MCRFAEMASFQCVHPVVLQKLWVFFWDAKHFWRFVPKNLNHLTLFCLISVLLENNGSAYLYTKVYRWIENLLGGIRTGRWGFFSRYFIWILLYCLASLERASWSCPYGSKFKEVSWKRDVFSKKTITRNTKFTGIHNFFHCMIAPCFEFSPWS